MAFESLSDKLTEAFKRLRGKGRLTEADVKEAMKEVRMALLEADVSYKVVKDFTAKVTERASGEDVLEALSPAQMVVKIVNEELCALMGSENKKLNISSKSPSVVMLVDPLERRPPNARLPFRSNKDERIELGLDTANVRQRWKQSFEGDLERALETLKRGGVRATWRCDR